MNTTQFGKKGWTPERIESLKGKTYVITGTTSGTGFEAAKILLSKGATVVILNRNQKKAEETITTYKQELGNNIQVIAIQMDLSKQASVKKAAQEILKTIPQIDALICNAAIAQVPKRTLIENNWEIQMGTNYFGNFTLQALLFPLIKKSKGRIVTVGSMGYTMGLKTIKFNDLNWKNDYTPNAAYSQSKLAQIMSIYELQNRLQVAQINDVKAYACHPGASRTNLISTSGSFIMRFLFFLMMPFTQSAKKGAYSQLMCATEPILDQKGFYGPTGRSNWVGPVGAHKIESHAKDKDVAKKLWELSENAVGIKWNFIN